MARLLDGFKTLITFAANGAIKLYEKEVTPPGLDGGSPIDTSTMRNVALRTKSPQVLYDVKDVTLQASYDPAVYNDIKAMININQQITITFPDTHTLVFWGYLQQFTPGANAEGAMPIADVKIVPTNVNASLVETAPIYA